MRFIVFEIEFNKGFLVGFYLNDRRIRRLKVSNNKIKMFVKTFCFFHSSLRMKDARENSSRVSKEWENLRISYTFSTPARFLVRRLGHLLVNPERLEKGYKRTMVDCERRERGSSWKSPRRVITPPTSYYSPSPPRRAVLAFSSSSSFSSPLRS